MAELRLSPTPYDDVFRTLLNNCSKLIIPVINELFGEEYTGDEVIEFSPNEHFLNQQDGNEDKRITDSNFAVVGKVKKRYHLECESTIDFSILIRIFEYDAQIALDQASELVGNRIIVSFPNTAVLFLRSTKSTPNVMQVVIRTPGGEVSYDVPVMKVKAYTIGEIFEKKLLFLIPFYIFTYESRFRDIEKSAKKLEALTQEYEQIRERLDRLAEDGVINEFYRKTIMGMSERVLASLAKGHGNIRKGVRSVMRGHVLDYEAKRIWDQGIEWGREQGMEQGALDTLVSLVKKSLLSVKDAAEQAGMTEAVFREKMASASK